MLEESFLSSSPGLGLGAGGRHHPQALLDPFRPEAVNWSLFLVCHHSILPSPCHPLAGHRMSCTLGVHAFRVLLHGRGSPGRGCPGTMRPRLGWSDSGTSVLKTYGVARTPVLHLTADYKPTPQFIYSTWKFSLGSSWQHESTDNRTQWRSRKGPFLAGTHFQ